MAAPVSPPALIEVGDYVFNTARRLGCSQLVEVLQKSTGKLHCGKLVPKEKLPEFLQQEGLVYKVLKANPHPNILLPTSVVEGDEYCAVIFPHLSEDLHTYVRRSASGLTEREARPFFRSIVGVVAHLHANRIVARDLRLGKFFLNDLLRGSIVFADFESAQVISHSSPFLTDRKGSPAFVGPEVVVAPAYDGAAADMWSLGVILYILLRGSYPFHDSNPATLFQKIQQGHSAVSFPPSMSESARDVVCSLLTKEPHLRPTASDLVKDIWVSTPSFRTAYPAPIIFTSTRGPREAKRAAPPAFLASPATGASASKRVRGMTPEDVDSIFAWC